MAQDRRLWALEGICLRCLSWEFTTGMSSALESYPFQQKGHRKGRRGPEGAQVFGTDSVLRTWSLNYEIF
jgi:hypothetical protein